MRKERKSVKQECISSSTAVNAIDTQMRYFEQCQLTTAEDTEQLSAVKHLSAQKQASILDFFKQ